MSFPVDRVSSTDPAPVERRGFLARLAAAVFGGAAAATAARAAGPVPAAFPPQLGEIRIFAGNFAPLGWAFCEGQLLPISQYESLFSLLGTTYGGDGQETFALPDLRGRAPVHMGQRPGASDFVLGNFGGTESETLTVGQLGSHQHALQGMTGTGTSQTPAGQLPAGNAAAIPAYGVDTPIAALHASAIGATGGTQPHEILQPYVAMNFIICLEGFFPSQS